MSFTEDLTPFFADFGDDGTLVGQPVRGIYDAAYLLAPMGASGISAAQPAFTLASASVPAQVFQALLVIPQGSFKVIESQPDGTGVTVLILQKA
jgi:hypothetical protein